MLLTQDPPTPKHSDLAIYNTTKIFSNDNHMEEASEFADHFWETFMPRMCSHGRCFLMSTNFRRRHRLCYSGHQCGRCQSSGHPGVRHLSHQPSRDVVSNRRVPRASLPSMCTEPAAPIFLLWRCFCLCWFSCVFAVCFLALRSELTMRTRYIA